MDDEVEVIVGAVAEGVRFAWFNDEHVARLQPDTEKKPKRPIAFGQKRLIIFRFVSLFYEHS